MSNRLLTILMLPLAAVLAACGPARTASTQPTPHVLPTATRPVPTSTPVPPTPTPEPPAVAWVNGQAVTLEAYEKELARCQEGLLSLGRDAASEGERCEKWVLDALVEQLLIEQAAAAEGVSISSEDVEAEMQLLAENGQQSFESWLERNQYTAEEFRAFLRSSMTTQAMYERVTSAIPHTVEQVRVRHIVVDAKEIGQLVLSKLNEGTIFATLAVEYSLDESTRPDGGDLGFFPRGLLFSREVEEAAFTLEVGANSEIIESDFGYHIIQVLEKDPDRPVGPEVRDHLCRVSFELWLQQLWAAASVERNISREVQ